ncbi:tRNA (N6-threonylcarbamoyladenosine(37)-N6)-methyltransferase TrmO [Oscillatoria sp. CS-180]|uniref:tRNA (N6-threonylcarbamoyladenosine(37)-N6)-methyltransferase TrmO n=1 Tax=Oscillatoria sp. CS-180 TaxID=3021720 RepID=UPI002330E941|nr:tRNA (N6-threonylcarbamoyladenosine(37)-N6)-methyltransferase TrmO [Oscillatoria sp. CS-180]MDB9524422.1 tRNA (N6-threonylcarbamoyladenosine(37)-N6)-methyltransferase TrmO [Oscillatoria sp. CS-180]
MPKRPPKHYSQAVDFPCEVTLRAIGIVRSPYTERHGTPRQSQLSTVPSDYNPAIARIELFPDVVPAIALKDLEGFEYLWVIAWLHLNHHWNPTVMPPRGPRVRRGTLATRAPHRPNPISLSVTRILKVEAGVIHVEGIDLLDQTPVLDIKPYIPYCDAFPQAKSGYVDEAEKAVSTEDDIFGQAGHPFK